MDFSSNPEPRHPMPGLCWFKDKGASVKEAPTMLNEDTADCLALANTAILMRLIEELIDRTNCPVTNAVSDLESCPEFSTRVEDAIKMIRKELIPRIVRAA
jgi:hypothetical protein